MRHEAPTSGQKFFDSAREHSIPSAIASQAPRRSSGRRKTRNQGGKVRIAHLEKRPLERFELRAASFALY
eukprot:scaffold1661_cov251-Pinguiococcus_pyrenoidosus.AAC.17